MLIRQPSNTKKGAVLYVFKFKTRGVDQRVICCMLIVLNQTKENSISLFDVPPTQNIIIKRDKGDSAHYWRESNTVCLTDVMPYNGLSVIRPDADTITPSKKGVVSLLDKFSIATKIATTLPHMQSSSLISLGQLFMTIYSHFRQT